MTTESTESTDKKRFCKNHPDLTDPAAFTIRKNGFCPNLCRECERTAARAARRRRYATPEGKQAIKTQNANYRKPKPAPEVKTTPRPRPATIQSVQSTMDESAPRKRVFVGPNRTGFDRDRAHGKAGFEVPEEMYLRLIEQTRSTGVVPLLKETPQSVFTGLQKSLKVTDPLPQTLSGLNYLDNVFSHRFDAKTSGQFSLSEVIHDDVSVRKIIKYIADSGREPSHKIIMRNLQFTCMAPSHFFPSAATAILSEMVGLDIFDPFLGWGGRALGAYAAGVKSYTGTDLQEKSVISCEKIKTDFSAFNQTVGEFHHSDFVKFMNETERKFDCVFTSPPFAGTEDYGSGVSNIRTWVEQIIVPLVANCKKVLKPGGKVVVHGQDSKSVPVLSILIGTFMTAGYKLEREVVYGRREGQAVTSFTT